jgi:hypothetical protein
MLVLTTLKSILLSMHVVVAARANYINPLLINYDEK